VIDHHEQSRQRIYQIALGDEDCNDADSLRLVPSRCRSFVASRLVA